MRQRPPGRSWRGRSQAATARAALRVDERQPLALGARREEAPDGAGGEGALPRRAPGSRRSRPRASRASRRPRPPACAPSRAGRGACRRASAGSGTTRPRRGRGVAAWRSRSAGTAPAGRGAPRRAPAAAAAPVGAAAAATSPSASTSAAISAASVGRRRRIEQALDQLEAVHGVLGVGAEPAVGGGDLPVGEAPGERRAADEERRVDPRRPQVVGGHHHLLGALDQQAREADDVRAGARATAWISCSDGTLMPRFTTSKPLLREDDVHQVLADVVDVALDRREQHLAARWRPRRAAFSMCGSR